MFNFLQAKSKCPSCKQVLSATPTRKQNCPHCGKLILVRGGELITEDEANIREWLLRLEWSNIKRNDFDNHRNRLSKKFAKQASVNDTVWSVFNQLVLKYGKNLNMLERVYQEMASLLSSEGKDPTKYLIEVEKIRRSRWPNEKREGQVFLGHDELAYVRGLCKAGKPEQAEELLYKADPTPAVLDELRKIASKKAKIAKRNGDWESVVKYLEAYNEYAAKWQGYLNQVSPSHTSSDSKLLEEARQKLAAK